MNITALAESAYNHITATPTLLQFVMSIFITFFLVYRYNVQRRIRYRFKIPSQTLLLMSQREVSDWMRLWVKLLNCESCFGFWLCFAISTNIVTGAAAFLLFNYYEKK